MRVHAGNTGLVAAVIAATARPAHAGARIDPHRELAAAADAERAAHYEAAIGHYLRANDVQPHPLNLYSIAVDYERLGRLREAAAWYRRYLDASPAAADRDRVARALADLQARPSPLAVSTIPAGAQVAIDGNPVGTSPLVAPLPGGTHRVAVELEGQHAERDVELAYGEPASAAFPLGGLAGTLSVGGVAVGATVWVDDVAIGVVPASTALATGAHHLRVTAEGYTPYEATIDVAADAEAHVEPRLELASMRPPAPVAAIVSASTANDDTSAIAFLAGAAGGAEVHGGGIGLGMIGTRISRYDLLFRAGRAHEALSFDFMLRVSILDGPITPFVAGGYSHTDGGYGYVLSAGVRWDAWRVAHAVISLVADGGLREVPVTDTTTTATTMIVEPLELGAEVLFR